MADPIATPTPNNVPATYTNYFTVAVSPQIVRIAFGEAFGTPESATFHTAVSMLPSDAKALADTILSTLTAHHQAQMATATAAPDTTTFSGTIQKDGRP
jgi:hypothetical protein